MGVYTTKSNVNLSEGIIECQYEPGIEAALNIVAENESNYNAIMQAVGCYELSVLESTGSEMIYEASDVKGLKDRVIEFFRKIWEKIKGVFKKFFALLDSYTKSDKDFVNKYKKHLLQVSTRDFEYKGFKFTNLDVNLEAISNKMQGVYSSKCNGQLESDTKSDMIEEMRGKAVGQSSLEASELTKELFMFFRNGEDSKDVLDNISVSNELMNIQANSDLEKKAKKAYSELEKIIKKAISEADKEGNAAMKKVNAKSSKEDMEAAGESVKYFSELSYFMKEELNILQVVNGAQLTAIKDQNRQSKSICVALMNYKPKNESYNFDDVENESSFLSNVVLR